MGRINRRTGGPATGEQRIAAGEFKARCLRLLDEVASTGEALIVTKHGRPVARVVPISRGASKRRTLKGSILLQGDLISPTGDRWNALEE